MSLMKTPIIKRKYKQAFSDSLLITFFTVMPTFFTYCLMVLGIIKTNYVTLYDDGELLLYSISFLGSAYIIYKQLNNDLFKSYGNTIIACIFFISVFYTASSFPSENKHTSVILILSIVFVCVSIPFLFGSQVMTYKESPDVPEQRNAEQEKIEDNLR